MDRLSFILRRRLPQRGSDISVDLVFSSSIKNHRLSNCEAVQTS